MTNGGQDSALRERAAMLVGRIVLFWGGFEHRLESTFIAYQQRADSIKLRGEYAGSKTVIDLIETDRSGFRTKEKINKLKSIIISIVGERHPDFKDLDKTIRRLHETIKLRHDLAHSYVHISEDFDTKTTYVECMDVKPGNYCGYGQNVFYKSRRYSFLDLETYLKEIGSLDHSFYWLLFLAKGMMPDS